MKLPKDFPLNPLSWKFLASIGVRVTLSVLLLSAAGCPRFTPVPEAPEKSEPTSSQPDGEEYLVTNYYVILQEA